MSAGYMYNVSDIGNHEAYKRDATFDTPLPIYYEPKEVSMTNPTQPEDHEIRVGDKVRIGVYVLGKHVPMSLAIVVEDVDAQLCRVDKMALHGGAPWITLEQKSNLRKEPNQPQETKTNV